MRKKKKVKQPNWDLMKNKMMKYVINILQEKWKTPVILDVYEFKKIPWGEEDDKGAMTCMIHDGELYVEGIYLKIDSKEKMVYALSHELGHILDFIELSFKELSLVKEIRYDVCDKRDKRVLYEMEKRACSKGLSLLQQVGLPISYLEKYLVWGQILLGCIVTSTKQKKRKKK